MVFFRKSDVLVAGDLFLTTTLPVIDVAQGGHINGVIAALNRILDITVPKEKQEGGTFVIPGSGRLADEADVVDYRDMVTIIRDRIHDSIEKERTLEQVKAARLGRDYEGRWGATRVGATDAFVEAAYRGLTRRPRRGDDHGGQACGGWQTLQPVRLQPRCDAAVACSPPACARGSRPRPGRGARPAARGAVRGGPADRRGAADTADAAGRRRRSISPATGCRSSTRTGAGAW